MSVKAVFFIAIALYAAGMAGRIIVRKYYLFLPDYVRWATTPAPVVAGVPVHVFLLFVDHFEPDYNVARVHGWGQRYAAMASRHHDSAGRMPQHTWFYPGEQRSVPILAELRRLVDARLGEVELHYHHEFDSADGFTRGMRTAIEDFQRFGFLKTVTGETRFAFIHGNSGLDNSNGAALCGVNNEIALLRKLGCFGDYTFPSVYEDSQPPSVNSIYAAKDDDQPKSYARQLPLETLRDGRADLLIFQGPLLFAPTFHFKRLFLDLDDGDIHATQHATPQRVDRWIKSDVHVGARPDWLFIKLFAHGVSSDGDEEATAGADLDQTFAYLERAYNDGHQYVLHYVTARQAYNLVRAAVDGASGDPERYLDQYVGPYAKSSR